MKIFLISSQVIFKKEEDLKDKKDGEYLQPNTKIFPSVDSLMKPNMLFQITVSARHGVHHDGLLSALEKLGNPENPHLYFVVPKQLFDDLTFQSYTKKDKRVLEDCQIDGKVRAVSQFALCLSFEIK